MQLRKRVEGLEARFIPPMPPTEVHIIGMELGETEAEALARYGRPIPECDHVNVIFLVPGRHDEAA